MSSSVTSLFIFSRIPIILFIPGQAWNQPFEQRQLTEAESQHNLIIVQYCTRSALYHTISLH